MSLEIRRARDGSDRDAAMALRQAVFVDEQGVPAETEADALDSRAIHLVAVDADGRVQGTCRLLADGPHAMRVGRLCVAPAARRRGLGTALLAQAEREAHAAGATRLAMHAQSAAASLYRALGYEAHGETFTEAGIEHVAMDKSLA